MKKKIVTKLLLLMLIFCVMPMTLFAQQKVRLTFWNMPFVTQEVSPAYVARWEKDAKTRLPNYIIDNFYGPGKYADQRDKFLVLAKSGKPDVIEGLLEDVAVYVEKDLIEPLDSYFNAWEDRGQFDPATIKPLTINGKLYGIPYNTNARGIVYRKDILQQYNLKVPTTWNELITTTREITKRTNKKIYGFSPAHS